MTDQDRTVTRRAIADEHDRIEDRGRGRPQTRLEQIDRYEQRERGSGAGTEPVAVREDQDAQ